MSYSDQRVEEEARNICREQDDMSQALAFWLLVVIVALAASVSLNIFLLVTR